VTIVTPALGPSLGMPGGHVYVELRFSTRARRCPAPRHARERRRGRSSPTPSSRRRAGGQHEAVSAGPSALHGGGLDEQHVSAGARTARPSPRRRGVLAADSWKNFWRPSASRMASTSIFHRCHLVRPSGSWLLLGLLARGRPVVPSPRRSRRCLRAHRPQDSAPRRPRRAAGRPRAASVARRQKRTATARGATWLEAIRVAVLRSTVPEPRSRLRTPASCVYRR